MLRCLYTSIIHTDLPTLTILGIVQRNYFPDTDRSWKKDWPPVVELTWKMMDEKKKQSDSAILKRKHEQAGKQKIDDTMLGFQDIILPAAGGCHPNITIGTQSNKIDRFNAIKPLRLDTSTDGDPLTSASNDEDDEDEDYVENTRAAYDMQVDEDGTRHYTTADGKKNISYKKNAPQNGKLYTFSCN